MREDELARRDEFERELVDVVREKLREYPQGLEKVVAEFKQRLDARAQRQNAYERASVLFLYNALLVERAIDNAIAEFFVLDANQVEELIDAVLQTRLPMGTKVAMFRNLGPLTSDPDWFKKTAKRLDDLVEIRNHLAHRFPRFDRATESYEYGKVTRTVDQLLADAEQAWQLQDDIERGMAPHLTERWRAHEGET